MLASPTFILFLPENAILIQILPTGGFESIIRTLLFRRAFKGMNKVILEYTVSKEEHANN